MRVPLLGVVDGEIRSELVTELRLNVSDRVRVQEKVWGEAVGVGSVMDTLGESVREELGESDAVCNAVLVTVLACEVVTKMDSVRGIERDELSGSVEVTRAVCVNCGVTVSASVHQLPRHPLLHTHAQLG